MRHPAGTAAGLVVGPFAGRVIGTVTLVVLVALLSGCGHEATEADDPAPTTCPSYAAGDRTDIIVGVDPEGSLASDAAERARVLDGVGERLCLHLTEVRQLATGAVLVRSDRSLDAAAQRRLTAALEKVDGVRYAEPDAVVTVDGSNNRAGDGSSAGSGAE
jgi:hypothetical protein